MKRIIILLALLALAPSIIDQFNADFAQGEHQNTQNLSNQLLLAQTQGNFSLSGTFLSDIKELGSNPLVTIGWVATIPPQTSLLISTRSGNSPTPDGSWSPWSTPYASPQASMVTSPMRRYYQYRVQLATTDNQVSPAVDAVTITYTEQGPIVTQAATPSINTESTGSHQFFINIQDTLPLLVTEARYRIGQEPYTGFTALSQQSGVYYINISEPIDGWQNYPDELIHVQVRAENAQLTTVENLTQTISRINQPPSLNQLPAVLATEGQATNFTVSAQDPDGDNLTFTSSRGTVTPIDQTSARILWTPTSQDVPNTTITITVSDGQATDQATLLALVEPFNFPPIMQPIADQTGYFGEVITFDITVLDQNVDENMTFWVEPSLFRISELSSNMSGVYRARARFVALDAHRGVNTFTFYASDGELTTSQNATLTIGYCGDGVCQSQENATACPQDCQQRVMRSHLVLEVPDRFCVNQTATIQVYNASSRYSCFLDGRAFQGAAFCSRFQGASITIFEVLGQQRQQVQTLTSNAEGQATFTPSRPGRYRFIVEHDDMMPMDQLVTVNDCSLDINLVEEVVEFERPQVPPPQRAPPSTPQIERPELTPDEVSLLSILVWYIIIPLLAAALIYTSSAWYDLHKDSNVTLLKMRIAGTRWMNAAREKLGPVLMKLWIPIRPVVQPVIVHVHKNLLLPTRDLFRKLLKR